MASGSEILLTQQQHSDLSSIAQSRALPAGYVFRAKLILMLAEGASFNAIKRQLQTTSPTIVRWKQRFRQHGLEGLDTYHPGQKPRVLTPALRARILSATRRKRSCRAIGCVAIMLAACTIFSAAWNSPSALTILARRSRSASACLAMARFIVSGRTTSRISTDVTFTPHGSVCLSMIS